jgi:type IV pilus assembly protein PilB
VKHHLFGFYSNLVVMGHVTEAQLSQARALHSTSHESLSHCLVQLGAFDEPTLLGLLSKHTGMPVRDIKAEDVDRDLLARLPHHTVRWPGLAPLRSTGDRALVAICDPSDVVALDEAALFLKRRVTPILASRSSIAAALGEAWDPNREIATAEVNRLTATGIDGGALQTTYSSGVAPLPALEKPAHDTKAKELPEGNEDDAPVVRLADLLLSDALAKGASDIHIEPQQDGLRVRYRIDGMLQTVHSLPATLHSLLTSRLKIMARMNITVHRRPQDGRLLARDPGTGKQIDVRISTLPTLFGEKTVMRLLSPDAAHRALDEVLAPDDLKTFEKILQYPQGLLLVTGPTGSGKTTTLYSALTHLQDETRNFVTLEQPVEIRMPGINQVDVRDADKVTFEGLLKTILRQDPDVVLIGEIRDPQTAHTALQAAMTGHFVLSSLHTIDAASAIARMTDLGGDPFLLAETLAGVAAQRLLRRLCSECRVPTTDPDAWKRGGSALKGATLYTAVGCESCGGRGYRGRLAAFEILPATPAIRAEIHNNQGDEAIRLEARRSGVRSMFRAALLHVAAGETSLEEVLRVIPRDPVDAALSCGACGVTFEHEAHFCVSCGHAASERCKQCKAPLSAHGSFCQSCGTSRS